VKSLVSSKQERSVASDWEELRKSIEVSLVLQVIAAGSKLGREYQMDVV
jgi:hypothetical protein